MKTPDKVMPFKSAVAALAAAMFWMLSVTNLGTAQVYRSGTIDAGTSVIVRTNETIDTKENDGRVYMGVVEQDVKDRNNRIAIPRGSDVEMVVRNTSDDQLALDLESIMIRGQRYSVESDENIVGADEKKEGIGANKRTGKYVGGGAIIGAIIGGIAGGGKGAAIGAGAGAAAGAGAQVLTRGGEVKVPAESLVTFRLSEPLRAGVSDGGYLYNGSHYHQGMSSPDRFARQKPGYASDRGSVVIGRNNDITWQGPEDSNVYVQVDNAAPKLFASGQSGVQAAPWIERGHVYVFILRDANGTEIARARQDLR